MPASCDKLFRALGRDSIAAVQDMCMSFQVGMWIGRILFLSLQSPCRRGGRCGGRSAVLRFRERYSPICVPSTRSFVTLGGRRYFLPLSVHVRCFCQSSFSSNEHLRYHPPNKRCTAVLIRERHARGQAPSLVPRTKANSPSLERTKLSNFCRCSSSKRW